jgi:tetratricopeptide (TPR) repeat protein
MQYPSSVATTWQVTVAQLTQPERALLNILSWLAPEPIPLSLLEGVRVDGANARDLLSGLVTCSLARLTADRDNFTIHRLVQEVTRQRLRLNVKRHPFRQLMRRLIGTRNLHSESDGTLESALNIVRARLPSAEWSEEGWHFWTLLSPHCRALLGHLHDHTLEGAATPIMREMARWFEIRTEHGEAEVLLRRALAIDEKNLGPEHRSVAKDLNRLALVLVGTNQLEEAEPLYRRALAIDEKYSGPEDPNIANRVNNLADLLRRTARLPEAEQLFRRALKILQNSRGPEHPMVATVLGNFAEVLVDLGRPSEAEPLYRQALAIDERSPESENPALATSLNDLAELLRTTNRMSEAEPLYRRALEIDERTLGREHPNVARDLNNLALLLEMTDRVREGELLSQRAVRVFAGFARRTGHEHPSFGAAITNYARLLAAMNLGEDEILARLRVVIDGD